MHSTASTVRTVSIVVVAAVALLGTAYSVGRSLGPDQPPRNLSAPGSGSSGDPRHVDRSPVTGTPSTAAPTTAPTPTAPASTGQDGTDNDDNDGTGRDLPLDSADAPAGPYGSRLTTGTPQVALTFDDGPDPRYTPQALDLLRRYDVKATFCVVGENAQRYPELVRAIADDGHTLCNHSWQHDMTLGGKSRAVIRADLIRTNQAIRAAVPDARIVYFRQPGGAWTYPVVSIARELGMTSLHWTVDPQDWEEPGAASIATMVNTRTAAGAIVLLHDAGGNRQDTVDALHSILPYLSSRFRLEALPTDAI